MADASGTKALRCLVIFGCVFTAMCGLALMAVAIWVVVDPFNLYSIADVSGKVDIFAGGWIAIFTGFAFFCVACFGVFAAHRKSRGGMLVYLVLMLIVYIFECASCITAATHRDYLVGNSNLVKKQMLQYYAANSTAGVKITKTWNQVMENVQCCGADSPLDWIQYTSTYNQNFGPVNQWPFSCCRRNANFEVMNLAACKIGHSSSIYTQGCFQYIQSKLSLYTWAIGWYGFAVLMFVFIHMLVAMVYYIKL
ncbi:uroplakin-1a [Anguilla rostrata]|uniref:uroplakin-1a n=1 Tax=Anguilla rostrata TaxID=7938 RepID=UPI0030CF9CCA